ncbi:MAG: helix-turn-helix domain-containing protein, partial [Pseudomonadota bacterium]
VTIEAKALLSLVKEDITVTHHLLQFFAQEMMRYEAPQDHQIPPERRVYRHFLTLAEKKGKNFVIPQMPKHAVISEACGVTDQDVAKAVAYLIAENIIEREYPQLIIRDISALRALSY